MKYLLRIIILLTLAQGLHALTKNSIKTKGWVSSLDSNNLVQPESDVLFFDVYETTQGLSQRTKLGEAKLFFKDEFNVIDFENEGYFYSAKFEYIVPDKAVKAHMSSNCEHFDLQEAVIFFMGAGSSIIMECSGQKFHMIEKKQSHHSLAR
ncbi:hypothetical protein N9N66_02590 [Schleiferiaceae bacterium]|jgi:hypothetical protein|nr:hypothetical protein [Schleiferiaceae bacterium]MDA8819462.1 hypothetical protein [Schleiferiaceae bacterium]